MILHTREVERCVKQTYERLFFILCSEPVASREEGVGVGSIEPLKVPQIHTQPHLNQTKNYILKFHFQQPAAPNSSEDETLVVNVPAFA